MNLGEIRGQVREFLNEPTEGFWTDAQLNTLINIAHRKLNATISATKEDFFVVSATFQTVAAQKSYALPSDFRQMLRLEIFDPNDPHAIVKLDEMDFPRIEDEGDWPFSENGRPVRYVIRGSQMDLYPIPDQVYNLRIYYDQRQTDLNLDTDVPASPVEFHDMLAIWAAILAFQKQQESTLELAALYKTREDDLIKTLVKRKAPEAYTVEGYLEGFF